MGGLGVDTQSIRAVEIFCSYALEDERLLNEQEKHLHSLRREGKITIWDGRDIPPGIELAREIDAHLNSARIILLFVSPNFMSSDYCQDIVVKRAMERHEAKEARVIPLILRHTDWKHTPLSKLSPLPNQGKPITRWNDRNEAYDQIARGIRRVVEEFLAPAPTEDPVLREAVTTVLAERVFDEQRVAAKYIIEALRELSLQQKKVNELKRVHNMLHELEVVLELLAESIQTQVQSKGYLDLGSIKINWQLVPPKVEELECFALKMKVLEEKESSYLRNNIKMIGPKWVTESLSLQDDFEATLEEAITEKRVAPGSINDLACKFRSNCRDHLRAIDRRLLEAVDQVYQLSEQVLRSINHGQSRA